MVLPDFPDFSKIEEEYTGDETACHNCGRVFEQEELITVEKIEGRVGHIFCFNNPLGDDPFGGCSAAYKRSSGKVVVVTRAMLFKGQSAHPEDLADATEGTKAPISEVVDRLLESL